MSDMKIYGPEGNNELTPKTPEGSKHPPAWLPQSPMPKKSSGGFLKVIVLALFIGLGVYGYTQNWHKSVISKVENWEDPNETDALADYEAQSAVYLELENAYKEINRDVQKLKSKIKTLSSSISQCEDNIKSLKTSLKGEDRILAELQSKYKTANRYTKKNISLDIASSDNRAAKLERKLADNEKKLAKEKQSVKEIKIEIKDKNDELKELGDDMKEKAPELQKLQDLILKYAKDTKEPEDSSMDK